MSLGGYFGAGGCLRLGKHKRKETLIRSDTPEEISESGGAYIQLVNKDTIGLKSSIAATDGPFELSGENLDAASKNASGKYLVTVNDTTAGGSPADRDKGRDILRDQAL